MKAKQFITALKWLWVAAVVAATAFYLIKNWETMVKYLSSVSPINLFLAGSLLVTGKLLLVVLSNWSLQSEGFSFSFYTLFQIVALSQLGKYIPGGVWHFLGRINMYKEQDVSLKKSTRALVIESVWLLGGALAVGLSAGLLSPQVLTVFSQFGLEISKTTGVILSAVVMILWSIAMALFDRVFRLPSKKPDLRRIFLVMLLEIITWSSLNGSFALLWPQFNPVNLPLAICVYSLSWSVGYVTIFAPGGIGVREGMLTWLLSGVLAAPQALALSTVHRFLYIAVEIILGLASLIVKFLARFGRPKTKSTEGPSASD